MMIKNTKPAKGASSSDKVPANLLNKGDTAQSLNAANYKWYRDPKIVGTTILVVAVAMQIFAFLEVPFFYTLHGYTVGLLIGYYNPLFYVFIMVLAAKMIFGPKLRPPAWFKVTTLEYLVMIFLVIYIGAASGYYQARSSWVDIGADSWNVADSWLVDYTHDASSELWYLPANTNGGAVGLFMYSFVSMLTSGVGAFLIALFAITIVLSILFTGKYFGLYRLLFVKIFRRGKKRAPGPASEPTLVGKENKKRRGGKSSSKPVEVSPSKESHESTRTLRDRFQQVKTKLISPEDLIEKDLPADLKVKLDDEDLPFDDPFE